MKKKSILYSIMTLCMMFFAVTGFAQTVVFSEDFSAITDSVGGQDISTSLDNYTSLPGWTGSKVYKNTGKVKMGAGSYLGWIQTPAIDLSGSNGTFILEFDALAWKNDSTRIKVYLDGNMTYVEGLNNSTGNYSDNMEHFSMILTGGTSSSHIKFEGATANHGRFLLDNITITQSGSTQMAAQPTFSVPAGLYTSPITVSITSTTDNASIYYTTDGTTPTTSSTLYTNPITISQTSTLKAIATASGYINSTVASATYTFPGTVSNIAEFKALTTNNQPYLISNDVTFVFAQGAYTYVKDASAALLIYGANFTNTYTEGDQISNLMGNRTVYNGQVEMQNAIDPAASTSNTGSVTPIVVTISELLTNYDNYDAQLITIENVTFPNGFTGSQTTFSQGTNELTLFNRFGIDTTLQAGTTTSVTGFAAIHNGTIQICPRYNSDLSAQAPVAQPSLTINEPQNGAVYSTLDTLHVGIDIQNFTLDTDGYLKIESNFLENLLGVNVMYLNQVMMDLIPTFPLTPLPAGNFYFTASLVGLDSNALTPAVSVSASFSVVAPVLDAPVITAAGEEAPGDNTFYFNSTVTMTAAEGASIYYTTDGIVPTENATLYTEPFQVTATTTVKAIAVKANWQNSDVATLDVTITAPTVATPVFTPIAGTYADSVVFSLSCATDNAEIRYTTDGTEPTSASALYGTPITLNTTTTVKAKAFKADWFDSETAMAVYTVVYDPVLTVDATTLSFTSTQLTQTFTVGGAHLDDAITLFVDNAHFTVNPSIIFNPNSNTTITVTFDGTEPATGAISVICDTLTATVALTATAQLPAPVLTPATAVSDSNITVTMSCTVADAVLHYTIDGTEPTASSAVYSAPLVFDTPNTYTVKALAVKSGWENSSVVTGTYTINEPPAPDTVAVPVITPASDHYYVPQIVTITCATDGATIRYTLDGTEPTENSTEYSAPFMVSANATITAKAWKEGWIASETAAATISFPVQVDNIAAFKAEAATNQERQIMSDVTFVFRSGRFIFVEDNTAAMLIYDNNTPVITTQYNEGDVIEGGIFGKYTVYQGLVEMVPTHNANVATGTPVTVTPADATITQIKAGYTNVYEAKLVHLSDVEFINATEFVQDGDTMAIFNRFNTLTTEINAGDIADVTGFVSYSNSHGYQIFPRGNDDIDIHPVVILDTVATPEFHFYRSGEFYFMNLTCATDGASIYYTQDGSDPDESGYEFTSDVPFQLTVHYTLKAIAMKEGMENSEIAVYDYDPSSIEDYTLRDNLVVWPNPASDRVFIGVENENLSIQKVELYSVYGQLLQRVEVNGTTAELSVGSLATGTYIAKVFTEEGVATLPVIRK